jgi:hypothetical protein
MTVVNLTPHSLNFYSGNFLMYTIPSTGVARATQTREDAGYLVTESMAIPVVTSTFGETVGLPEPQESVALVVSIITANAAKAQRRDCSDLYLTDGLVRKNEETGEISADPRATGSIVGCTGLAKF